MAYPVFIPTAGTGSRLGCLTRDMNKSLLSIGMRPIISLLIEQFPSDSTFIIALGHQGHLVRDFLTLAYADRKFIFIEVDPFQGPGSSLGYTLWSCQAHLQLPFVFSSCDTLTTSSIPAPDHNWMAVAESHDPGSYRTISSKGGYVAAINEKEQQLQDAQPYIGLAGVLDTRQFWNAMNKASPEEFMMGESFGLRALVEQGIKVHSIQWHDTGNPQALEHTRKVLTQGPQPHLLEKSNEAIWFVNRSVIKYNSDPEFIRRRVLRAESLKGYCPSITATSLNMYRYQKVEGEVVSDIISIDIMKELLEHLMGFWHPHKLTSEQQDCFERSCFAFYHDKTYDRVIQFYKISGKSDGMEPINGQEMSPLKDLLKRVDWKDLSQKSTPVRFHGDCHFENMLYEQENRRFTFLDWRQDFAGETDFGDLYYDLAKLYHGMLVSHEAVVQDQFKVSWDKETIHYEIFRKQVLVDCEKEFFLFLKKNGLDEGRVRVLTALIFLNIAALHHDPYNKFLYCLGKDLLMNYFEPMSTVL